jgi:hypothetical protein
MSHNEVSFELRRYKPADGKMADLIERFQTHSLSLFAKHAFIVDGFWIEEGSQEVWYLLQWNSAEHRRASWKALMDDAEWHQLIAETEQDGPLVQSIERFFLKALPR